MPTSTPTPSKRRLTARVTADAPSQAPTTPLTLFYVRQNIDYLRGLYLISAVVAAKRARAAISAVVKQYPEDEADLDYDGGGTGPVAHRERLSTVAIGTLDGDAQAAVLSLVGINGNSARELTGGAMLLAASIGQDLDD